MGCQALGLVLYRVAQCQTPILSSRWPRRRPRVVRLLHRDVHLQMKRRKTEKKMGGTNPIVQKKRKELEIITVAVVVQVQVHQQGKKRKQRKKSLSRHLAGVGAQLLQIFCARPSRNNLASNQQMSRKVIRVVG